MVGNPRRKVERLLLVADRWRRVPYGPPLPGDLERVYCHHIRKTAGTSLAHSFLALGNEDPEVVERRVAQSFLRRATSGNMVFATGSKETLQHGRYFFGWSHNPAHSLCLPPHTFTVTVLRDPVARALSYFRYLLVGDPEGSVFRVSAPERRIASDGFRRFLDTVDDHQLLRQLYTFSAALNPDEAAEKLAACSLVLHTEDFSSGLVRLGSALGLKLEDRHDRATSGPAFDPTPDDLDRLRTRLEPEYRFMGIVAHETGSATPHAAAERARRLGMSSYGVQC